MAALTKQIENFEPLDRLAKPLQGLASRLVEPTRVRNLLSGTNLGHPAHPVLTDVPIGTWLSAALLDAVGGKRSQRAADLLVAAGIAGAVPTALTGLNDWSDTMDADRRVGLVHASGNVVALGLYGASLVARVSGNRGKGRALAYAGLSALMAGAYLGGHLSFSRGVNVNHTAFEDRPTDWTDVAAESEIGEGAGVKVDAGGASVLLTRLDGRLHALANTCTHLGGPLHEGKIADGCVTCPWHGSEFRIADGTIARGPASVPQPTYQVRVVDGRVQVRADG